jgi:hypothetical protein
MWSGLDVPFDRVTYRDGQLLTARDLQDEQRRESRLRWLHTRYLHDTWGIALGLDVHLVGRHKVIVRPGCAIDGFGREILLAETTRLYVPVVADGGTFVLTIGYQEDAAYLGRTALQAVCLGGNPALHDERPTFTWRRPDDVAFGPQVPLAQVELVKLHGHVWSVIDRRVRRYTRPIARPYMAGGETEPGRTGWSRWVDERGILPARVLGLRVIVNTAQADFAQTPYYFATLQGDFGERPGDSVPDQLTPGVNQVESTFFLDAFAHITHATSRSFTYGLLGPGISPDAAEERNWTISWLGIEARAGCDPAASDA